MRSHWSQTHLSITADLHCEQGVGAKRTHKPKEGNLIIKHSENVSAVSPKMSYIVFVDITL